MSTSTAIVIGSVIVAVGVYLGLGRQAPVVQSAPVAAPVSVVPRETVARQASDALAYQWASVRSRCPPGPGEQYTFVVNATFDAHGIEVMRGISDDRSNPRTTLVQCVAAALGPLRVPAPGATTMVEVPLRLP